MSPNLRKYDVALHFGVGYVVFAGRTDILIEIRYSQSVIDITESWIEPGWGKAEPQNKNSGLLFLVGFTYDLQPRQEDSGNAS